MLLIYWKYDKCQELYFFQPSEGEYGYLIFVVALWEGLSLIDVFAKGSAVTFSEDNLRKWKTHDYVTTRSKIPASNTFPIFERFYPILADKIS